MYNITLVSTMHKECGICNSIELHKIIEKLSPEIIFEELPHSLFHESYNEKTFISLETDAIKKYLENQNIIHIPVDTYTLPTDYHNDLDRMYDKITRGISIDSFNLRNLLENRSLLISKYGFEFLNSNQNIELFEEIDILKEKILSTINNENLFRINSLEKETIEKREYEIINNIYNYSKENTYNQAILFMGSGHRKSISKLIEKFKMQEKLKLNWKLYNV